MSSQKPWRETPLVESKTLSRAAGCRIFLKLDNLQPSGSFKARGIGYYMNRRVEERAQSTTSNPTSRPSVHFYASSGGNAGHAAVLAAEALGYPCTVVVPMTAKPFMIAKLRASGAHEVIQKGKAWIEADTYMREQIMAKDPSAVYVPPFDHPDIWKGHESVIQEIYRDWEATAHTSTPPAAIICSVGGGGLFNGVMGGLAATSWSSTTVIATETAGADSLAHSLRSSTHASLPAITSQATSLGCQKVSARTYELATTSPNVRSVVLSDAEAAMGAWRFADDERMLVELACGVNLALCYDGRLERAVGRKLGKEDCVVVVVCGGVIVTLEMLAKWREEFGHVEKMVPGHVDVGSDFTAPKANGS